MAFKLKISIIWMRSNKELVVNARLQKRKKARNKTRITSARHFTKFNNTQIRIKQEQKEIDKRAHQAAVAEKKAATAIKKAQDIALKAQRAVDRQSAKQAHELAAEARRVAILSRRLEIPN